VLFIFVAMSAIISTNNISAQVSSQFKEKETVIEFIFNKKNETKTNKKEIKQKNERPIEQVDTQKVQEKPDQMKEEVSFLDKKIKKLEKQMKKLGEKKQVLESKDEPQRKLDYATIMQIDKSTEQGASNSNEVKSDEDTEGFIQVKKKIYQKPEKKNNVKFQVSAQTEEKKPFISDKQKAFDERQKAYLEKKERMFNTAQDKLLEECTNIPQDIQEDINVCLERMKSYKTGLDLEFDSDDIIVELDNENFTYSRSRFLSNIHFQTKLRKMLSNMFPKAYIKIMPGKKENVYFLSIGTKFEN
jgi:hypothetical protein